MQYIEHKRGATWPPFWIATSAAHSEVTRLILCRAIHFANVILKLFVSRSYYLYAFVL